MIIAQMLNTINDGSTGGANKTSIMYKSYLSYAQLKEYLSFMVEKGLVKRSLTTLVAMKNFYTK